MFWKPHEKGKYRSMDIVEIGIKRWQFFAVNSWKVSQKVIQKVQHCKGPYLSEEDYLQTCYEDGAAVTQNHLRSVYVCVYFFIVEDLWEVEMSFCIITLTLYIYIYIYTSWPGELRTAQ